MRIESILVEIGRLKTDFEITFTEQHRTKSREDAAEEFWKVIGEYYGFTIKNCYGKTICEWIPKGNDQ